MVEGIGGGLYVSAYHRVAEEHDFTGPGGDTYGACRGTVEALGTSADPEHCVDWAYFGIMLVRLE